MTLTTGVMASFKKEKINSCWPQTFEP